MRNIIINGKDILQVMEEKPFKFLYEGKYKEAYNSLLHLKSKKRNLEKINFALGFICELEAIEGTTLELAKSYYSDAIELGSIEAKIRMAFLAEKGRILNREEAYILYKEIIDHYKLNHDKLSHDELVRLEKNVAFVYYRLGRMYEKGMLSNEDNIKSEAFELYTMSSELYTKHKFNHLDKARVLNRIGWLKYEKFLEASDRNYITELKEEIEVIEKTFKESSGLGNKEAKLGLLNIQAVKHFLIDYSPERNLVLAQSLIQDALEINSNHLPTLFLAAQIKTMTSTFKDRTTFEDQKLALDFIRRALKIDSANQKVRKKFDEIINFHSSTFDKPLEQELNNFVKEIIKNAGKKGASQDTINKSQKLQEIFFPEGYHSANWFTKQMYTPASLDEHIKQKIVDFIIKISPVINSVINQNKFFRELYNPEDQQKLSREIVKALLENEENLKVIKLIIKDKDSDVGQHEKDHITQEITDQFELFYNIKNSSKKEHLLVTREEHQWISAQEEFIKLFCEEFRLERNYIESIAKDKALPMVSLIDKVKTAADKIALLSTAPPFSYLGNALGANPALSALTVFATDYAHAHYKKAVISSFKEVDKMLPRSEEANRLILEIAKEIAFKYALQIANLKDYNSLKLLAEITIERMISHAFAQTGMVKQIEESIRNKVNNALNFVLGSYKESRPVNAKQLLYEGIWYGKSSEKDKRIRTVGEKKEFEDNWLADGLLERTGIITQDKRIFGNIKNITKYGCAVGDEIDITLRNLQPVDQSKLNLELKELKETLNKISSKQQKIHFIIDREQNVLNNKGNLANIKASHDTQNYSTLVAKTIIAIGMLSGMLALMIMYAPLLSVLSSVIPGLILAGSILTVTGVVLGKIASSKIVGNISTDIAQINTENKEQTIKEISFDQIQGPTPLDNYNELPHKSFKIRKSSGLLPEKHVAFSSRISSNSTLGFQDK
ncbi:hypothetical protein NOVO_08320 [Rickettsiales bacterium Ac37b]|nr:hypothetical protein NOVO_08320 [Rickettsiales bacterium Ac37b]